jgi:hypothetical protein
LRERLGNRALFGAAFVLAGILIAELLGPPAAPESPEPTGADPPESPPPTSARRIALEE